MLTAADVTEALRVCFDPELGVNVVDLGLVHRVDVQHDANAPGLLSRVAVAVELLRRVADDEREAMLLGQVTNRLMGMELVSRAHVHVVDEPAWSTERMTPAARAQLGLDRGAKPGLVSIQL